MSRIGKWYMRLIGAIGIVIALHSAWRFFFSPSPLWSPEKLPTFCSLLLLSWICYCLPLYVRDDCTVDLSFISIQASILTLGPEAAVIISLISYPISISSTPGGKEYIHIFNTAPIKTFFNIGNCNISLWVGGLAYYAFGGTPGNITLPGVLPPAFFYIAVSMAANVAVIFFYYRFSHDGDLSNVLIPLILGLLPSIALSSPIGYFLAMLLVMDNGVWLALLFMLPLLLARYSFKLYLDGRRQQFSIIKAFAAALDAKDAYTQGHSSRVAAYTVQIATAMHLPERRVRRLADAAVFHDIGKIGVPDSILQKPGALTPEERAVIQRHPQTGVDILRELDSYQELLPLIRHHHEFYDGRGYPDGTKGDEISLDTYILGAADAFDAITSDRPYRHGRSTQDAVAILLEESGKQFHPDVVAVVADMAARGELGPDALEEEDASC